MLDDSQSQGELRLAKIHGRLRSSQSAKGIKRRGKLQAGRSGAGNPALLGTLDGLM